MYDGYVGYKLRIIPNKEQRDLLDSYFNGYRAIWNLGKEIYDNYRYESSIIDDDRKYQTLSFISLNNIITDLKDCIDYKWLNDYDSGFTRLVLKSLIHSYINHFNNPNHYNLPKFKKKKNQTYSSFPIRSERVWIDKREIRVPSIGNIKLKSNSPIEIRGTGNKWCISKTYINYYNCHIIRDHNDYYLTLSIQNNKSDITLHSQKKFLYNDLWLHKDYSEPVGIDLGCKGTNWIVDSNGNKINSPNTYRLEVGISNLEAKFNNKYHINSLRLNKDADNQSIYKNRELTKNEQKILNKLNKKYTKITNKYKNEVYNYCNLLLKSKPIAVIMEDLRSEDMIIRSKSFNSKIYNSRLSMVKSTIENIITANGINFITADKYYPSTQICSCCGNRIKIGRKRVYKCLVCNLEIDRDYNASLNLKNYYYKYCEYTPMISIA